MARQKGIMPVKGTIGNLSFYKSRDGYLLREKGGVEGQRINTDPAFQRTRENGAEFGSAGKSGKLLRTAVRALTQNASDGRMVSRLIKVIMKVIKSDSVNPRGSRTITDGDIGLLQKFEFNIHSKLDTTLLAPYNAAIDRVAGELTVDIPAFIPMNMIAAPTGATHFRINAGGAEVDFNAGSYVNDVLHSAELPIDTVLTAPIALAAAVTPNSTLPLFLVVGIEFFQEVNAVMYPLKNGAFNALSLVMVSGS